VNTKVPGEEKPLNIRLLGAPEVSIEEGHPLRFNTKKSLALLCYLAVEGGRHPRRELAELLWPKSDERHARTDLRSALAKLRKTLGEYAHGGAYEHEVRYLLIDGDLLGVESGGIKLDLEALQEAVSLARRGISPGGRSAETAGNRDLIGRLRGDLDLYRGEFMEGFSLEDAPEFELWLEAECGRWRRVFGELCERLSRLESEGGDTQEAIETARVWARHSPLEEGAHRRLMELLSGAGESEEALLAFEDFRQTLSTRLESEPSTQMQELAGRLHEEVKARSSLGASLARSSEDTLPLSVLEVPLAGRQEEFGALVSEYQAARMGQTRVAVVLGEAGIGKTRLAEEFLGWARAREADALEGGTSESGGLPYGPLVEAIRPRIERERAPDDLLEDVWLSELSRLLPELKERYPDLPFPTSGEAETAKGALFETIARLVGNLASRAPVILFLDDLEWADAATLEVLDYASKHWAEQGWPILILIAARSGEPGVSSSFERWLSALGRRLPLRSLTLGPLGDEDVKGLLGRLRRRRADSQPPTPAGTLEDPEAADGAEPTELESIGEWLAAETGGQPFYLVETLKALLEEGKLVIRGRADGEEAVVEVGPSLRAEKKSDLRELLPTNVREVIRSRLSRLSPEASQLLGAGAVLERGFDFESLVGVAGLEEAEGLRGLDELIERHLLQEVAGGQEEETLFLDPSPTYTFTHEKIRQVAYTEMGHARRRLLHHRAFEVLEGRGTSPPAELARQALAGGLAEPAFGSLVAAGDQAMEVFAVKDAIEHYDKARNLLAEEDVRTGSRRPIEPSTAELEHLYIQLGRAYEMANEWGRARAAYETMLAFGRQLGEATLEVVALNHLAVLIFHQRETDPARARTLLEEARQVAEEAGLKEELVETECNLAEVMTLWAGEFEHSAPLARKALASARASEERPDVVARALFTLARLELIRGRLQESAAYAEEGAKLSRELAQRPAPRRLLPPMLAAGMGLLVSWRAGNKAMETQCLLVLAYDRILQGRLREGIESAREALSISRELPAGTEARSSGVLGRGLVEIGEYEEGLALCRRGTEMARKLPNMLVLWLNLDSLGRAYEALLDLEEARRVHEEALELGGQVGRHYERWSSARLCAVAALSEEWEEAYARAKKTQEGRTSLDVREGIYLYHEVEALLRGGDESSAREEVGRFAERAETNERERVAYLRSLAVLNEFEGDTGRAIDHLHEARALAEKIGLPKELWQIQARIGELHERCGKEREAAEAFSLAAQTLRELAQKTGDEKLRERFFSAPQARRVLERS
jgi:DNA-binding SARP family transcriptional activator/tetratricopeptide (TPR) repeat protein